MRGAVCAASRLRAGASRALGATRCFAPNNTWGKEDFQAAGGEKGTGAPMKARFHGEDWRMPSDAVASLWLEELEGLE